MDLTLPHGRGHLTLTGLPAGVPVVLPPVTRAAPIAPEQWPVVLADKLRHPIGAAPLREGLTEHPRITIIVPDKTRKAGQGQVIPALIAWLEGQGVLPERIRLLIGLGTHPGHAPEELNALLTPEIAARFPLGSTLKESTGAPEHAYVLLGSTSRSTPVRLHPWLTEPGLVIVTGNITYHYYAGYTGGRKGILPGCAERSSIRASHQLAFDRDPATGLIRRHPEARLGVLEGNPIVEDQWEAARMLPGPVFLLNTITDPQGGIIDCVAGHLEEAHRYGCTLVDQYYQAPLAGGPAEFVIASAGGFPGDINLIQSHKALDHAVRACAPGGRVVLLAECSQGLGNPAAREWLALGRADAVLQRLGEQYEIVGGTVEGLLRKAEEHQVTLVTGLDPADAALLPLGVLRMDTGGTLDCAPWVPQGGRVLLLPAAGITLPVAG